MIFTHSYKAQCNNTPMQYVLSKSGHMTLPSLQPNVASGAFQLMSSSRSENACCYSVLQFT